MENTEQKTQSASAPSSSRPASRGPRRDGNGQGRGGAGRGPRRDGRGPRPERVKPEFEQKMLSIRRVTRVVSGGRRFSFSVALAIGDGKGTVGIGIGKANDTTLAIQKAFNDAKKNKIKVRLNEKKTIPHEVKAKYKASRVMLMPNKGRGVVVGSAMRIVVELAGITDITGKVISGSKDKITIARATMKALATFASARKPFILSAQESK